MSLVDHFIQHASSNGASSCLLAALPLLSQSLLGGAIQAVLAMLLPPSELVKAVLMFNEEVLELLPVLDQLGSSDSIERCALQQAARSAFPYLCKRKLQCVVKSFFDAHCEHCANNDAVQEEDIDDYTLARSFDKLYVDEHPSTWNDKQRANVAKPAAAPSPLVEATTPSSGDISNGDDDCLLSDAMGADNEAPELSDAAPTPLKVREWHVSVFVISPLISDSSLLIT